MKKRIIVLLSIVLSISFILSACTGNISTSASSTFSILFIDVGQGDSALVECDGHYMLIDAGNEAAGDKVYSILEKKGAQHLDILAISHMHEDHIGGLKKALSYSTIIDKTIANVNYIDAGIFSVIEHELGINGASITVPHVGEIFNLGSAKIEVVDVASEQENDSLVLMVTYGKTNFLFTGDIEGKTQKRIAEKYTNEQYEPYKINLIKMPHHGSYNSSFSDGTNSLYQFINTFMPDYAVISVGRGNRYGHPHYETLDKLNDAGIKTYRTDESGDILVKSNGTEISITTNK